MNSFRHLSRISLLIFGTALAIRIALILLFQLPWEKLPTTELMDIARSLAEHGTFADPYHIPTGPTAHSAPLTPLLIAGILKLLGDGVAGNFCVYLLSALFASMQYAMLPLLAVSFGIDRRVGVFAGLAGALLPFRPNVELMFAHKTCVAFLLVLLLIITMRWWRAGGTSILAGGGVLATGLLGA